MNRRILAFSVLGLIGSSRPLFAGATESLEDKAAATGPVAQRYFAAYVARDWSALEPLLAEEGFFIDPTAEPIFGKVDHRGKRAVMKNFREGYAAIKHMAFNSSRTIVSGAHAVFEGTLDWTLGLEDGNEAITRQMPFLTILKVQTGLVVEHTDYADYRPFLEAVRRARGKG